jgi:hypothetical protein
MKKRLSCPPACVYQYVNKQHVRQHRCSATQANFECIDEHHHSQQDTSFSLMLWAHKLHKKTPSKHARHSPKVKDTPSCSRGWPKPLSMSSAVRPPAWRIATS